MIKLYFSAVGLRRIVLDAPSAPGREFDLAALIAMGPHILAADRTLGQLASDALHQRTEMTVPYMTPLQQGNSASVRFKDNADLQKAFDILRTVVPTKWASRGRLEYSLFPVDEAYGDPLERGLIMVVWHPVDTDST
jgi:hypothetical protein